MSKDEEDGLKHVVAKFYSDLASPSVQQVGKALGTVFGLLNRPLTSLEYGNARRERVLAQNLIRLDSKIAAIAADSVVEIPPEVGVPIVEKLFYVSDDELVNLYTNLLKCAATDELSRFAHPSFVNVVLNLSPDEAKLLNAHTSGDFAYLQPYIYSRGDYGYSKIECDEYYSADLLCIEDIAFPLNVKIYAQNLSRLGILDPRDVHESLNEPDVSEKLQLRMQPTIKAYASELEQFYTESLTGDQEEYQRGFSFVIYEYTEYGLLFQKAVGSAPQ